MTESSAPSFVPTTSRLHLLDGLRGVAVLLVMIFHYTCIFPRFVPSALPSAFTFEPGLFGVHLFFIISGFVILMTLEKRGGPGQFMYARFVRLYPIYWVCVLLTVAVLLLLPLPDNTLTAPQVLINLTMLTDFVKATPVDGVYWSLTYELGFYAFMFFLFKTKLRDKIDWVAAYCILGAFLFLNFKEFIPHPTHYVLMVNFYSHLFGIGLVFYQLYFKGVSWPRAALILAGIGIMFLEYQDPNNVPPFMALAAIVISVALMAMALFTKWVNWLGTPVLLFIGRISYALYLTHQMIGFVIMHQLQKVGINWWGSLLLTMVFAIALAAILTLMADEPLRRLLRRRS